MFYHFTNADHAISNIENKRLKIARILKLNDPYDLSAIYVRNPEERKKRESWIQRIDQQYGIICFSKNYDSSPMWGHYGDNHAGICLGFDIEPANILEVSYIKNLIRLPKNVPQTTSTLEKILKSKHDSWCYENEIRILTPLVNKTIENGNHFEPFSDQLRLREVILGHKCNLDIDTIRSTCESIFQHRVFVKKTRLAYTAFKVIEDRGFRER